MTKIAAFVAVMAIVFATALFGQDPGVADTVRLGSTTSTTVPVYMFNDEPISKITIPLLIDGYSGWAVYNSISYVGSLLADPSVLDLRQAAVVETDTFSQAILLLEFEVGTGSSLPAGTGKLCDLVFTYGFGGTITVDSTTVNSAIGLSIADASANSFIPQFQAGSIQGGCDYMIGDIDNNGIVATVSDLLGIQKELYWHLGFIYGSPYAAVDLNCDRHGDMRDVVYLSDFIFHGGPAPCSCGTYSPAQYSDPGTRDTLSVSSKTIAVGAKVMLQFNLSNDEAIHSFAFGLEWDGTATMERTYYNYVNEDWDSLTARMNESSGQINDGYGFGEYDNGVNPDTFHLSNLSFGFDTAIQPGTGAIFFSRFKALSPGTLTFNLRRYDTGAGSMMIDMNRNAILPEFVSGVITVIPRPGGDANFDGLVNISDAVYLINYIFNGGPAPNPLLMGDEDCNGIVTISDAVYLVNYIFAGGPAPCGS